MTTFTGPRGFSTIVPPDPGMGFVSYGIPGWIDIAANPVAADIYQLCYVPAGFVITGGTCYFDDIDTHASETLEFNLGWAANGGSGTYDAVDTDGLGDFGVTNGDAFAAPSISATAGNIIPFAGILADGIFPYFTKKTLIQAYTVATCATFTAGRLSVEVRGYVDPSLVVG